MFFFSTRASLGLGDFLRLWFHLGFGGEGLLAVSRAGWCCPERILPTARRSRPGWWLEVHQGSVPPPPLETGESDDWVVASRKTCRSPLLRRGSLSLLLHGIFER